MLKNINGRIEPEGWILEHLLRDKEGITGNLGVLCAKETASGIFEASKVKDETDGCWSSWWPGESEGNWRDAFARLAFALGDEELIKDTKEYIERVISCQESDGYMGIFEPGERFGNGARSGELWTMSRIMICIMTCLRGSFDQKAFDSLEKLADLVVRQYGPLAGGRSMYKIPDEDGSKTHGLMMIEPLIYLYDKTGKKEYLDFSVFLYDDFSKYAPDAKFPCYDLARETILDKNAPLIGHGAHTCESLRIPLLLYHGTGNKDYLKLFEAAFEKIKGSLSLSGSVKSDEMVGAFHGKITPEEEGKTNLGKCYPIPSTGYEYCSTVELMMSLTAALKITGDVSYADYVENDVLNAGMAARRQDGKAILYLSSDNLYRATKDVGDRWDYSPTHSDAAVCCAPNSGKLMPFHLENMYLEDLCGGIHTVHYGPSVASINIKGVAVRIRQKTAYPFENSVLFEVTSDKKVTFDWYFRVPSWCGSYSVSADGKKCGEEACFGNGKEVKLSFTSDGASSVKLDFKAVPTALTSVDGTKALKYGALLYSLDIKGKSEEYYHYDNEPFADCNVVPEDGQETNFTLLLSNKRMGELVSVVKTDAAGFEWDASPISLSATMLSSWSVPEYVTLVPIGTTDLRRTTFPAVDIDDAERS